MLQKIVKIIDSSSRHKVDNGTLYCYGVTFIDDECITFFEENNILESTINQSTPVDLELTLAKLNSIGYYEDITVFILKNRYVIPQIKYHIDKIKHYNVDTNEFVNKYTSVISLIDSIKNTATYMHTEIDIHKSSIYSENKMLSLPFIYDSNIIQQLTTDDIIKLKEITTAFSENENPDKKKLFINELIEFLSQQSENDRFLFFLSHITKFVDRANAAYQYYIRNFSYNKLKAELDNSALEYSRKIQSVINDAQTKLIAIPTALVLAVSNMDFSYIFTSKNVGIISSMFIFSLLIDLFIKNQKSALTFIKQNIDHYKESFEAINKVLQESFKTVDSEWKKQNTRITIIRIIRWGIPILLLIVSTMVFFKQKPTKPIIIDTIIQWAIQICQK